MGQYKWKKSFLQLGDAIERLKIASEQPKDEQRIAVDATIQRFKFTIELFWKTLKRCLQEEGVEAKTPKETLIKAYQAKWLDDEEKWLLMLKDRNITSHLYSESLADKVYNDIKLFIPELIRVYQLDFANFLNSSAKRSFIQLNKFLRKGDFTPSFEIYYAGFCLSLHLRPKILQSRVPTIRKTFYVEFLPLSLNYVCLIVWV